MLQLPSDIAFDVVTPGTVNAATALPRLADMQQGAAQTFPEIKFGQLAINIADLDIAKAKSAFKPSIKINGSICSGYNDVLINRVFSKTNYLTQTGNNFFQTAGVSLSVPIFSQKTAQTALAKSKIEYRQALLNLQSNQVVLSQAVEQAFLTASNAQQAYVAANQQLVAATESYRIANEQVKFGAINSYDLLQQRNQYIQAVQAFTQSRYTAVLQQKIYEFYIGKPITLN